MISVVLPARNEAMVYDTARWMLQAGADEIVIIDDGSSPPVQVPPELQEQVELVRLDPSRGPAHCRNLGGQLATGDVIIYSDAHVRPSEGGIIRLALAAQESGTIVGAACRPMEPTREWTGYGGIVIEMGDGGLDVKYNRSLALAGKVTGYIGSVYAGLKLTWERIGWWPQTLSWGYNEQALSLAVLYAGLQPACAPDVLCLHHFKKKFNYPVERDITRVNRFAVHFQLCGDFETNWLPRFQRQFPHEAELWDKEYTRHTALWDERRAHFRSLRKRTDGEVNDVIRGWDRSAAPFAANRVRDTGGKPLNRVDGTVCLFTAFAPGREACLGKWVRHVEAGGYPIDGRLFVVDSPRPDVELYARDVGAVVYQRPPLASREDSAVVANHLAGHWNMVLPELLKYDYILSVEDDVYPETGYLRRLLKFQRSQPSIGAVGAVCKARGNGHLMAYPLKSLEPWDIEPATEFGTGRHAVGSISLCCTLIRTTCIPKDFQFTGQPNIVDGQPAGRRGHEFSLWKALAVAGHKIGADYDLVAEHRVLTEDEPPPPPPPPTRHGRENFIRSRHCCKRLVCTVCRASQVWRDCIRQEYSVPSDWDSQCPNGLISNGNSLGETRVATAALIGQAAGRQAAGLPVLADRKTVEKRWALCKACKDGYIEDEQRCRQGAFPVEPRITLAASACEIGRWSSEEAATPISQGATQ